MKRRSVSLLCALLIAVIPLTAALTAAPALSASAAAETVVYDFENYGFTPGQNALAFSGVSISEEQAHSAGKSLKYALPAADTKHNQVRVAAPNKVIDGVKDNRYQMTAEKRYRVSFWYFVDTKPTGNIHVSILSTGENANTAGQRQEQFLTDPLTIGPSVEPGTWIQHTTMFQAAFLNANDAYNRLSLGFRTNVNAAPGAVLYIDDVSITETADPLVFPKSSYDFEDAGYESMDNATSQSGIAVSETVAHSGSKAIQYAVPANTGQFHVARKLHPNKVVDGVADNRIRLRGGSQYQLSLWYYLDKTPEIDIRMTLYTTINNAMSTPRLQTVSNPLVIDADTPTGKWLEYKVVFTADVASGTANYLCLGFAAASNENPKASLYIDDVTIEGFSESIYDFENYGYAPGSNAMSETGVAIAAEWSHSGGQSLKYALPAADTKHDQMRVAAPNKVIGEATDNRYKMTPGKNYEISFWYLVDRVPTGYIQVSVLSTGVSAMANTQRQEQALTQPLVVGPKTPAGTWVKYTALFTATCREDNAAFNRLCLGFNATANASPGAALYIDDVTIEETDEEVVLPGPITSDAFDFEDYGFAPSSNAMSTTGVEITGEQHHSAGKSLKYALPADANNHNQMRVAAPNKVVNGILDNRFKMTPGKNYEISFWYLVDRAPTGSIQVSVLSTGLAVMNDKQRQDQALTQPLVVGPATQVGTWVKYTALFTAACRDDNADWNRLCLGFNATANASPGAALYIDDLTIEETDKEVVLPDPIAPGAFDFEDYGYAPNSSAMSATGVEISAEQAHGGEKSLKYALPASDTKHDQMRVAAPNKVIGGVTENRYKMTPGKNYEISFWYLVDRAPTGYIQVSVLSTGVSAMANTQRQEQVLTQPLVVGPKTPAGTWVQYTALFTAACREDKADWNRLCLGFNATTNASPGAALYIDDLTIEETTKDVVLPGPITSDSFDFEDYGYAPSSNAMSTTGVEISAEQAHGGSHSLKYALPASATNHNGMRVAAPNKVVNGVPDNRFKMTAGKSYEVCFWYYIDSKPTTMISVSLLSTGPAAMTTTRRMVQMNTNPLLIHEGTATGVWVEHKTRFTATFMEDNADWNRLCLGFQTLSNIFPATNLYIDDLTIAQIDEPVVLPELTDPVVYDFELYGYAQGVPAMSLTGFTIDGGAARSGSKSLKFHLPDSSSTNRYASPNTIFNGKLDNRYRLQGGSTYEVSFWYYVPQQVGGAIEISLWATHDNVMSERRLPQNTSRSLVVTKDTPAGQWHEFKAVFHATLWDNDPTLNLFTLSARYLVGFDEPVFIDDVSIRKLPDDQVTVVLSSQAGPHVLTGQAGDSYTLPQDLTLQGYRFDGWYDDALYETPHTNTVFKDNETVYGKWVLVDVSQGFEHYSGLFRGYGHGYDMDIEVYTPDTPGYNRLNVFEGSAAIHRIGRQEHDKRFMVLDNPLHKLSINTPYLMTFMVKVESTQREGGSIELVPRAVMDITWSPDEIFYEVADLADLKPGGWYRVSTLVTSVEPYLALRTPGSSSIYFDAFTFKAVEDGYELDPKDAVVLVRQDTSATGTTDGTDDTAATSTRGPTGDADETQPPDTGAVVWPGCWVAAAAALTAGLALYAGRRKRTKSREGAVK